MGGLGRKREIGEKRKRNKGGVEKEKKGKEVDSSRMPIMYMLTAIH